MRMLVFASIAATLLQGCSALTQVEFVYFNLSGKEICVTRISGLPSSASPGVLVPSHDENNRLEESVDSLSEVVLIRPRIKITWEEDGTSHELELGREYLHLPSKIGRGKVRFT
jgi:hypothetical protein